MKVKVLKLLCATFALIVAVVSCNKEDGTDDYKATPYATLLDGNENMPCGGTISVDYTDAPEGCEIDKLVDNDWSTKFVTSHTDFYIVWRGNASATVSSYSIVSAPDSPECDPTSWIMYGSSDGSNWTMLDERRSVSFSERGEMLTYEISTPAVYRYYRLRIRANNGGATTQMAEWYMYSEAAVVTDIKDALSNLVDKMSGSTYSADNPMGIHFLNCPEATSEQLSWLADASQNPPLEASGLSENDGYSWTAVNVTLYPYNDPVPADVNQHAIGDCCLPAVLASFAYLHPDFIKKIISGSGTSFSVAMYDPKGDPITVAVNNEVICSSSGDIAAASGKNNTATWSTILEKAVMKWEYVFRQSYPIGGIGTEVVAPLFTGDGNSFAFSPGVLDAQQLATVATTAVELGYIIVGGFTQNGVVVDSPYLSVSAHAFTIMMPQTSTALFAMRNPWGTASGSSDGLEDGVMNVYDDGVVPPLIDFRICYPGLAGQYPGSAGVYTPPSFSSVKSFWLSEQLRAFYGLD